MMCQKRAIPVLLLVCLLSGAALSCNYVTHMPNPFASPTPTATLTFTPTVTPSPTPTSTPTVTPTPKPSGMLVRPQTDGRTLVRDWDNGYEFLLPQKWIAMPMTQEDIDAMAQARATEDPEFAGVAGNFKDINADTIRLIGEDLDAAHRKGSTMTFLIALVSPDRLPSGTPMDLVAMMIENDFLADASNTTSKVVHNAYGVDVGVIQGTTRIRLNSSGGQVSVRLELLAFQCNGKLIMLVFVTPAQLGATVLPALDPVIDTILLKRY